MKVRFVGIVEQRNQWFVVLDQNFGRHKNVIGRTEKGVLYKKCETRINLITATLNGRKKSVDIYPILKEYFPHLRVDKKLLNHMRTKLNNKVFTYYDNNFQHIAIILAWAIV